MIIFSKKPNRYLSLLVSLTMLMTILFSTNTFSINVQATTQATYYVSTTGSDSNSGADINHPFLTIARARDFVRTVNSNMIGDFIIYIRGGTYNFNSTLQLNQQDSGTNGNNIIYKAYPGETPILNGGMNITSSWTLYDSGKNIYRVSVGNYDFRQLYVNGSRATRARTPNPSSDGTGGPYNSILNTQYPFQINSSEIGIWANDSRVEFHWLAHWSENIAQMDHYTTNGSVSTIYFKSPQDQYWALNHHWQENPYYYWENSYEFLDQASEWYLDTNTHYLYYIPRNGENMSTATVTIPTVDTLIKVAGTNSNLAHNIQFYGLTLNYTNWVAPNSYGYFSGQAGVWIENGAASDQNSTAWQAINGMLELQYTNSIRIERNKFKFGGGNGIVSFVNSDHNTIIGNVIDSISGGGIYIGVGNNWSDSAMNGASSYDTIKDNYITDCGIDYLDSVGIWAGIPTYISIQNNEITNLPFDGISIGWTWGDGSTYATNNNVSYNKIHNVMRALDDGGGIYSLGNMPNTTFNYNYIFNLPVSQWQGNAMYGKPNAGIYLDNGSCGKTVSNNVINNSASSFYAINPPNHDNYFSYNYFNSSAYKFSDQNVVHGNNVYVSGQAWPQAALNIINSAGIESAYSDIIPPTNEQSVGIQFVGANPTLTSGNYLRVGQYLKSASGNCFAILQRTGIFCIYSGSGPEDNQGLIWSNLISGAVGDYFAIMQNDGSFCIYVGTGPSDSRGLIWSSNSVGQTGNYFLSLQNDTQFCINKGTSPTDNQGTVWSRSYFSSNSYMKSGQYINSPSKNCFAILQSDGNLCIYNGSGPYDNQGLIWSSGVTGPQGDYFAIILSDGKLCIYHGTGPTDNRGLLCVVSSSDQTMSHYIILQDDKHLCIYRGTGPDNNQGNIWYKPT